MKLSWMSLIQHIIMAVTLCTVVMDAFLLINDMVETDKVGTFYYINIAMLIVADLRNKEEKQAEEHVV